ncbi:hypothetical protein MVEN_00365400 [Mycena venus]|uniref:Cytochrome c oxidase assembly protein COX20, mitochondrial n=1 Tax=Mycena venus TaxID=2733690 RepID=A0A8H7DAU5_9AGAR|nr:hypothetical protein MVEN_00365400 [Mycena venus]
MPDSKSSAPLSGVVDDPANIPPPRLGPPSTGNLVTDSFRSAFRIGEVPCARNSLLAGIASGVGIGFIRGMSAHPIVAGSWGVFTWALVSATSFHFCTKKFENQQQLTRLAIEKLPKQLRLKEKEDDKET